MEQALLWLSIGASAAIGIGYASERARFLLVPGVAVVVYLGSYAVWFVLRYLAVIPPDVLARTLCLEPHELSDPLVQLLVSTLPPAAPVGFFLYRVHARRKGSGSERE